jgi:hypothetical protein
MIGQRSTSWLTIPSLPGSAMRGGGLFERCWRLAAFCWCRGPTADAGKPPRRYWLSCSSYAGAVGPSRPNRPRGAAGSPFTQLLCRPGRILGSACGLAPQAPSCWPTPCCSDSPCEPAWRRVPGSTLPVIALLLEADGRPFPGLEILPFDSALRRWHGPTGSSVCGPRKSDPSTAPRPWNEWKRAGSCWTRTTRSST